MAYTTAQDLFGTQQPTQVNIQPYGYSPGFNAPAGYGSWGMRPMPGVPYNPGMGNMMPGGGYGYGYPYGYQQPAQQPAAPTVTPNKDVLPPKTYMPDDQEKRVTDSLENVLVQRMMNNYAQGKPILDEAYRNAILGQAQMVADKTAKDSSSQLSEQMNAMGLLGSSGHGTGLGEIQNTRARNMQEASNNLTAAELDQLKTAISGTGDLQNALMKRGALNQEAGQNYANYFQTEAQNKADYDLREKSLTLGAQQNATENSQWQQSMAETKRNNLLGNLFGGIGSIAKLFF